VTGRVVDFRPPSLYIDRASRSRATTLSTVALFALLAASGAGAEQERVDGMGRTRGWVVADDGGALAFVDCHGRRSGVGSARIESASGRCPTPPMPHEVTVIVRSVDPIRRIVHAEDHTGRLRAFHVPAEVPRLEELNPGERIHASGPIDGQITGFARH
jgi:hypothetical protein